MTLMGDIADMYDYYDPELECDKYDVRCKYCKRSGYTRQEFEDERWRLVILTGRIHKCKAYINGAQANW